MTPFIRSAFGALSKLSPEAAGYFAHRLFSTPLKIGKLTGAEKRLAARADARLKLAERMTVAVGGETVVAHRFGREDATPRRTIILVHGWMSGARYMLAMVDPLIDEGYAVVCLDLPAHGASSGKSTNLVECANAVAAVIDRVGGADIVIAHSFGGAVTAYTLSKLLPGALGKDGFIVLLASPNQLSEVTRRFGAALGLSDAARKAYESRLCAPLGGDLAAMDGNKMYKEVGLPMHVIHSVDDCEVSIEEARRFTSLGDQVRIIELDGLGHRKILYHPSAIAAIVGSVQHHKA
jgi:pimeloyl-ACP methyl ester carboxylesterase